MWSLDVVSKSLHQMEPFTLPCVLTKVIECGQIVIPAKIDDCAALASCTISPLFALALVFSLAIQQVHLTDQAIVIIQDAVEVDRNNGIGVQGTKRLG